MPIDLFGEDDVKPCRPGAQAFAQAIIELMTAQAALEKKKEEEPDYMPTSTSADWVAEEQETWNRAADKVYDLAHPGQNL